MATDTGPVIEVTVLPDQSVVWDEESGSEIRYDLVIASVVIDDMEHSVGLSVSPRTCEIPSAVEVLKVNARQLLIDKLRNGTTDG